MSKRKPPQPSAEYMRTPQGKVRDGDSVPYGTIAPIIRETIDREGVVKVAPLVKRLGFTEAAIHTACKNEERAGRAVHMFAAYWHPEVAAEVREVIAKHQNGKAST